MYKQVIRHGLEHIFTYQSLELKQKCEDYKIALFLKWPKWAKAVTPYTISPNFLYSIHLFKALAEKLMYSLFFHTSGFCVSDLHSLVMPWILLYFMHVLNLKHILLFSRNRHLILEPNIIKILSEQWKLKEYIPFYKTKFHFLIHILFDPKTHGKVYNFPFILLSRYLF